MFYNRGEVLSDQFDHFKLILFWVPECLFCKKIKQNGIKWEFFQNRGEGGGVPDFPHFPVFLGGETSLKQEQICFFIYFTFLEQDVKIRLNLEGLA